MASMSPRDQITAVAALEDRNRAAMYEFSRRAGHPVSRDEAANEVGISTKLAAFHLDKLVEAGLLRASVAPRAETARVGRRPKVYEPSNADISVGIPHREHGLLADILVETVLTEPSARPASTHALHVAAARGRALGKAERTAGRGGKLGAERALTMAESALDRLGYEPSREAPTRVRLRNCPFHPLTEKSPELLCGINHAFLGGFLEGLEAGTVEAVLDPRAGECCVEMRSRQARVTAPD